MTFVLDSSIALGWIYIDEMTPSSLRISEMVSERGAWVPAIWRLEVGNSLQLAVRRRRIDASFRDKSLADLSLLNISVDSETDTFAWTTILRLAERFRLTLYDACYLELAQRRGLALATLDRGLSAAAAALHLSSP